jgi:hypothetical protein
MNDFLRGCGVALLVAAVLMLVIQLALTPPYLQYQTQGDAAFRSSGPYLLRISAALVDTWLLLFGCVGLQLAQRGASGRFGAVAFVIAFAGTALMLALEWTNLFVLRALAQSAPEALAALDKSSLMTAGFASGAGLFLVGWLLFCASLWRANRLPRWASFTAIAGLLALVPLGAALGNPGQIAGNVIFGVGLAGLGRALARMERAPAST